MMITKINLPNIGTEELEVTEIMIKSGENIKTNQILLIIEGDKTSMEIPSPYSGIVTQICVNIGDKVHTGSLIMLIDTTSTHIQPPKIQNKKNIYQKEISTSNAENDNNNDAKPLYQYNKLQQNNTYSTKNTVHATPLIRHIARTLAIDLSQIKGSGRKGRILKEDIQNYMINQSNQKNNITLTQPTYFSPEIQFDKFGKITTMELTKIQQISGTNLHKNWNTIPHVTQFDEVDITNLEIFRRQQNHEIEKKKMNFKITPLIFVMKAVAKALEKLPKFNSSLSQDGKTLILKKYINIGIAVSTNAGLLIPVIHDVNKKGIIILSQELSEISKKARSQTRLAPSEIQGGSFTISSLGNIGGTAFTPIVNVPEVAILGISKASIKPIWNGKKFIPRLILPLSLSYDHRAIDGADGAEFVTLINKMISDIRLLSM